MKAHRLLVLIIAVSMLQGCSSRYRTSRSPFRKKDSNLPTLTVNWQGEAATYSRSSSHYEQYPLFEVFDKAYFDAHTIPDQITSCDHQISLSQTTLNALIENLIEEIKMHKSQFTDFIVLQRKNFNRNKLCGLLVLRFKEYPFVLKLFMETPESFINPYCKGIEPTAFFFMSGGSNRHIAGLTRMYNLEYIAKKLSRLPQWSVHLPRKWFWEPQNNKYLEISGTNISENNKITTLLPSTYGIIADAIEVKENHSLSTKKRNDLIMQLCTDLDFYVDPHSDNYLLTQDQSENYTIHILDTEHFPSMVGIRDAVSFNSHIGWYVYLAEKCAIDAFFRPKHKRTHLKSAHNIVKQNNAHTA